MWGIDDPASTELFHSIKSEGYHGVEIIRLAWKDNDNNSDTSINSPLAEMLNDAGLSVVCQIHTAGGYISSKSGDYVYCGAYDVDTHMTSFKEQLLECKSFISLIHAGGFVNVHGGVDAWPINEAMDFLTAALHYIEDLLLPFQVTFETHRQRLFGSPFQTREILSQHIGLSQQLRLNADLSHWYCACERVFDPIEPRDECWWPQLLEQLSLHCTYIHARLGWAQGPQMSDPSAPEFEHDRILQINTWKRLLKSMKKNRHLLQQQQKRQGSGNTSHAIIECYMSPEYGPMPYSPVMPHTQTPVASLPRAVEYTKALLINLFDEVE